MYTSLMLRLRVCRATEIMVGWGGVGWGGDGMMTFLAHVHIFDATSVCVCVSCTWCVDGNNPSTVAIKVSADCFAVVQK